MAPESNSSPFQIPPDRQAITSGIAEPLTVHFPLSREDQLKVQMRLHEVEQQILSVQTYLSLPLAEVSDAATERQVAAYERVATALRTALQTAQEEQRHRDAIRFQWIGLWCSVASTVAAVAAAIAAVLALR